MTSYPSSNASFVALPLPIAPVAALASTPSRRWPSVYRMLPAALLTIVLLTAALLVTVGPTRWWSRTSQPTTPYADSVCHRAAQNGNDMVMYTLCPAASQIDRCCPIAAGWGAEAVCTEGGMSCYGYDGMQRVMLIVMGWVGLAVWLCVICCLLACARRPSREVEYQPQRAADGVYLVLDNSGSYGRME